MKKSLEKLNIFLKKTSLPVVGGSIACMLLMYQAESLEKVKSYAVIMIGFYLGWILFSIICVFLNINVKDKIQ